MRGAGRGGGGGRWREGCLRRKLETPKSPSRVARTHAYTHTHTFPPRSTLLLENSDALLPLRFRLRRVERVGSGGRVREGGQKEDQGRGGVRKREQRNEELSRAAANSREIPWQSSVCTRERVSNEIDSRRQRRRRQSEDAVSTCEAHPPPSPRKIGCGATNCTSLVRVFDRSICWICVRCVRKYMKTSFSFSPLDRRNRVENFLGTEERVKSRERNGGISSSGLIEVTVEIHARLTIDLVSFSVRGVAASLCPRTGSSTVPYSANRREFRVRIRASIGLSGRRIGGRRESLPLCASLRSPSLPFGSVSSVPSPLRLVLARCVAS